MRKPDDIRPEFDFSKAQVGRYAEAARDGSNIIRLDDDVAEVFHNSKQVNDLLRSLVSLMKKKA